MIPTNIILTVLSPYTAILPLFFIGFKALQKNYIIFKNPWNVGLIVLFIWSLFSGIVNLNPVSSAASVVILLYFLISIYLQNHYYEEDKIDRLLKSLVIFSVFSAFIGIIEKLSALYAKSIWWGPIFGIPKQIAVREGYRIYSTFGNPNVAGTWFAAMILICYYFYDNSHKIKKLFYAAVTCLFVTALVLTASRGAALGLEFGIVIYAFFRKSRERIGLLVLISLLVMVLMFILPEMSSTIQEVNNSINHRLNHSVNSRQSIWQDCLKMFKVKPVTGWGLMGIYFASSDIFHYYTREPHAHNIWLTIATTLGVVGLLVYIYMKYYLFECIRFLSSRQCRLVPLLAGIQALIIGHGFVDFTVMTPQGSMLFFGCSALISALALQYGSSQADGFSIFLWSGKKRAA